MEKSFFAHKETLDLLNKRISNFEDRYRQNIAIIGKEGSGKTFLLFHFLNLFFSREKKRKTEERKKAILPVYLELKKGGNFEHFAIQFIKKFLFYFLGTKIELQQKADFKLDFLLRQSKKYFPLATADIVRIKNYLKDKKIDSAYSLILKLPHLLTQESNTKLVILLDEFHYLGHFKIASPFSVLAKEIVIQKDVLYILTSSAVNLSRKILSQKLSLLLGNFEVIKVEPFGFGETEEFFKQDNPWITISSLCRNFLIAFTDGHPAYLKAISKRMKIVVQEKRVSHISFTSLQKCLYEELFLEDGRINQLLSERINNIKSRHFDNFICILFSLAEGDKKIAEIAKKTGEKRKNISKFLSHFLEKDIIRKNGLLYGFKDSLLKFWLNNSYRLKREDLSFGLEYAKKEFLERTEKAFLDFSSENKRDLSERVKDLLDCWRNEILLINNKKHKLPHFVRVQSLQDLSRSSKQNKEVYLVAQAKNRSWVGKIEKRKVGPKAISEFIENCKKVNHKYKIARRFLIVLKGIEIDAKILAKEEKIWILGIKELNFLLDFYGKSKIVIG
ncbi:MAG: hypothetical protein KAS87_00215 [Candidatus Omnitrophica bacterium]|nr:hypothetical protein [Candidatus Omnitrophota bacterium]